MKKIVLGVCGVLVFIGGLVSIRSGVLKAGELTKDSSLIVETSTTESTITVSESSDMTSKEITIPETESSVPTEEQPEIPVEESSAWTEPSMSSESVSSSASSDTVSSESSTTDSSTSTSETSASTDSTTSTSSSPSTSSTTKPSSSTSSQTKPSTTTPSSAEPTKPSASQKQKTPKKPVVPTPASPSASAVPATGNTTSVQSNTFVAPNAPEAFSETSTLNLPDELKTDEVAQSALKGFELPLLSSFKNKLMNQNRVKDGMMFKIENDPRIIGGKRGIGNFIRNYSI